MDAGEQLKKRLKFPEGYEFVIGIAVGGVKAGKQPHEPDFDKVSYI